MAEEYAAEHKLILSERTFRDLGVSGFKQKNVKQGALAAFIGAVKSGAIAKGSFLLIEQFDRLSRAEVGTAFRLLLDLVDLEITVVTLVDEKVWDSETVQDVTNVLTSVILMSRAHEESKSKAKRLRSAWGEKRKEARTNLKPITGECPMWLTLNADRTGFLILEDKAESVRKVFAARIGGYGISSIVNTANKEHWPLPGKGPVQKADEDDATFKIRSSQGSTWHTSTVGRLLFNRAVLGEYQPHVTNHTKVKDEADKTERVPMGEPILGYYPAIIDETTYLRAKAKSDRSGRFPGRRDASLKNWLQGLLKCTCGQSFVRKNKHSQTQPGYARYYCTARNRGITDCPGANAPALEGAVLRVVSTVAPAYFQGTARMEELKANTDLLEVEVSAARGARDRYLEAVGMSKAPVASLIKKFNDAEDVLEGREKALMSARAELADLSGDTDSVFENIVKAVRDVDSLDARAALREELSRIISKIVVHETDGYIEVYLRSSDVPILHPLRETAALPGLVITSMPAADYPFAQPDE
jgi:DNA invertase Pin-like site-specific DNA recombinase